MSVSPFFRFPLEIRQEIGSCLKASDLAALIQTCRRCYNDLQEILYNIALNYKFGPGHDFEKHTVLRWATSDPKQRKHTIVALVRKGADIFVKGWSGTLLHDIAFLNEIDLTKLLVESGIHPWTVVNYTAPFVYAAGNGHEEVTRYFLDDAVRAWQEHAPQHTRTSEKWSQLIRPWEEPELAWSFQDALHRAAKHGHLMIFKLLSQYVDVDISISIGGDSFIESASIGGSIEIMQMLLEHGAELNQSVFRNAVLYGHLALALNILSRRPMDIHDQDYLGRTLLYRAARRGDLNIVQMLLDHGADHEITDNDDITVLEVARNSDVIKILDDLPITTLLDDDVYESD